MDIITRNRQILELAQSGKFTHQRIAAAYGMTRQNVQRIVAKATKPAPAKESPADLLAELHGVTVTEHAVPEVIVQVVDNMTDKNVVETRVNGVTQPKAWNYYAQGKVAKGEMRNALRERLEVAKGATWKQLTALAAERGVDYTDITAPYGG